MNEMHIDAWMQQLAVDDRDHVLPDPQVIWLKAQVLQSSKVAERAARPITYMQIGAYAGVAACWAAILIAKWGAMQAWAQSLRPSNIMLGAANVQAAQTLSVSVLFTLVLLGCATVMVAMHTIFAEE